MLQPSEIERVLVVMAHPDDVDFSAAGTVALLTDAGVEVVYCLVTDGQAGGFDRSIPRTEMAAIRREEQTKAAAEVGVSVPALPRSRRRRVEVTMQLRHDISRRHPHRAPSGRDHAVAGAQPRVDLRIAPGPHRGGRSDDVRRVSRRSQSVRVSRSAVRRSRGLGGRRGLDPERARRRRVRRHHRPWSIARCAALRCHVSQHVDPDAMEARVRAWWGSTAVANGLPDGSTAESFRVIDTR